MITKVSPFIKATEDSTKCINSMARYLWSFTASVDTIDSDYRIAVCIAIRNTTARKARC
jgi:dUTPase